MSNIEKLKYQLQLQNQVKELLQRGFVDLKDPYHYEVIIAILNKPKLQKSANDLQLLSLAFTSIKFFNEMSKTTSQDELCQLYKELTYTRLPARRTVFHYGDIGKNFYIILRGSVWVLVAKAGLSDGQYDKQEKQSKKDKEVREQRDEGTIEDENDFCDNTDEEMLASKYPGMMKVGQVETEGSFGEIALTNFIPRQATIVCREDTHFIKLSREAFNKFLSEYYNRIQAKNFQFLKSINVFSDWPDAELSQIQYHMEPLEYSMNSVIYKEFEIIKGVYFVLEGQIEISESLQVKGQRSVFRQSSQLIQKKNLSIKLHRLGPGQLFGYQELIIGSDSRSTRAVCISEKSKVLFLAADRFKLYCIHNSNTNEKLILMVQQQEQIKQKATNIMLTNESFSLNANMSAEEKRLITNESIDHSIFKSESKRVSVKNQDTISPIGHRSQKLQSYYEFIQSKTSQNKDVKPLSFDSPLFEVNGGGRRITYERASQKSLHPQQLDSKQYLIEKLRLPKIFKKQKSNMNSDEKFGKVHKTKMIQFQYMLRKLGLLTEFCQQSMQHCFNFIYQDPIDQTGQLELKQYDTQKTPQQSRVQSMTQKMTQEEIPQQKQQKQDEDIDHDPFSEFQTKINFKSQIVSEIEKQPLKYAEEDIETDGKGWNDDEIVL